MKEFIPRAADTFAGRAGEDGLFLALGKAFAVLAHEIKNPLGAMRLNLSLLKEELTGQSASAALFIDQLDTGVTVIDTLIRNVLNYAKSSTITPVPCNLHAVIQEEAEGLMGRMCPNSMSLELSGNPFLVGDEDALRRAIRNILLNAAEATSFKGPIGVTLSGDERMMRIAVSDSGPGIEESLRLKIFEPFYSTKAQGTGLGLAIVNQVIKAHGGEIRAESSTDGGKGARFTITLPRRPSV